MASKVLLVEDDNNLREIYQARLQAEGYDIVSAKDGEEALVIAKQEQPDLIISDVMMPRVSGFEMLDILRNTEGLKDPKVIMLTALGQSDDQNRAQQLGADRYLVKSQVTLEDIVKAAQDLLSGGDASAPAADSSTVAEPAVVETPVATPPADPTPAVPAPEPTPATPPAPAPAPVPDSPATPSVPQEPVAPVDPPADPPANPALSTTVTNDQLMADALKDLTSAAQTSVDPAPEPTPATPPAPAPAPVPDSPATEGVMTSSNDPVKGDAAPVAHKKVIRPISGPIGDQAPNLDELLAKEDVADDPHAGAIAAPAPVPDSPATPVMAAPNTTAAIQEDRFTPPHPPGHVISPTPGAPEAGADPEPTTAPEEVPVPPQVDPEPQPEVPPADPTPPEPPVPTSAVTPEPGATPEPPAPPAAPEPPTVPSVAEAPVMPNGEVDPNSIAL